MNIIEIKFIRLDDAAVADQLDWLLAQARDDVTDVNAKGGDA